MRWRPSRYLAEFFGIIYGDGHIRRGGRSGYRTIISCNMRNEASYAKYITWLVQKIFGIVPHTRLIPHRSCITIVFGTKIISQKLFSLGIPRNHKHAMPIAPWILRCDVYCTAFLRGLFDTDGCITVQRQDKYEYYLLKISMKNHTFACDIKCLLQRLGFHPYICTKSGIFPGYDVVLRKKKDIRRWIERIGTRNPKNMIKIKKASWLRRNN